MEIRKISKPADASILQDLLFACEEMSLEFYEEMVPIIHLGPAGHREDTIRAEKKSTVFRHVLQSVLAGNEPRLVVHNDQLESILESLIEANIE